MSMKPDKWSVLLFALTLAIIVALACWQQCAFS
jgi:hypothetical protein